GAISVEASARLLKQERCIGSSILEPVQDAESCNQSETMNR
ncbi:hypothetical protein A2U01_0081180, partial [Trifolium medium]|nr:hypothetical protein [Trifolium medium]